MRNYKQLLGSFIEVITFLLASFGGFLRNIAPPDQVGAFFPVGALSFLALILLLIISAISRNAATKRWWIGAGIICFVIAVPSTLIYRNMLGRYTYPQSRELSKRQLSAPDRYLTPDAARYKVMDNSVTTEELVRNFSDEGVWTQAGIENIRTTLLATYACLVLSISAAIFCLLEANMRADKNNMASTKVRKSTSTKDGLGSTDSEKT